MNTWIFYGHRHAINQLYLIYTINRVIFYGGNFREVNDHTVHTGAIVIIPYGCRTNVIKTLQGFFQFVGNGARSLAIGKIAQF